MQTQELSEFVDYRLSTSNGPDFMVRGVARCAAHVQPTGRESHPAITDAATVQQFILASIATGFVTAADVAARKVEVTVEAREASDEPWDVYVFLNGTDCIFFEPIH
ncbi:hypothetical protein PWP93_36655 [Paraburkholderia sp. A1RI-2L]|uniref:hypothetical protein n=1 Tax=Paraburkholderia sp. A1RI-2L TaxID=3028367 RepID=UPI003B7C8C0C